MLQACDRDSLLAGTPTSLAKFVFFISLINFSQDLCSPLQVQHLVSLFMNISCITAALWHFSVYPGIAAFWEEEGRAFWTDHNHSNVPHFRRCGAAGGGIIAWTMLHLQGASDTLKLICRFSWPTFRSQNSSFSGGVHRSFAVAKVGLKLSFGNLLWPRIYNRNSVWPTTENFHPEISHALFYQCLLLWGLPVNSKPLSKLQKGSADSPMRKMPNTEKHIMVGCKVGGGEDIT